MADRVQENNTCLEVGVRDFVLFWLFLFLLPRKGGTFVLTIWIEILEEIELVKEQNVIWKILKLFSLLFFF